MDKERKKKILIVNNNLELGGVQRSLINLLNEVVESYDITLFLFSNTGGYKDLLPSRIKVIEAKSPLNLLGVSQKDSRSKGMFFYLLRAALAVYARAFNNHLPIRVLVDAHSKLKGYDVAISFLHSYEGHLLYGGCNDFVLRRVESHKKVSYLHCDFLECGSNTKHTRKLMERFDAIAAVSESCRKRFLQAMPMMEDKTFCVYNCHNYQDYLIKAELDPVEYPKGAVNILTVARIDEAKGILRAIEVIKRLIGEGYQIRWHLVGDGHLVDTVEKRILELGLEENILLYGNQSNPYRFMKNADLFMLPSYHEAAPMVFMEAKALRLPVLTTETISAREMFEDGTDGFICENSTEGIYTGLKRVLSNPKEIDDCREYLKGQVFSNQKSLSQFRELVK